MKVLRLYQSKSNKSELRELAMLSTKYSYVVVWFQLACLKYIWIYKFPILPLGPPSIEFPLSIHRRVLSRKKGRGSKIFQPDRQVLSAFSLSANRCPSNLKNAPRGLLLMTFQICQETSKFVDFPSNLLSKVRGHRLSIFVSFNGNWPWGARLVLPLGR